MNEKKIDLLYARLAAFEWRTTGDEASVGAFTGKIASLRSAAELLGLDELSGQADAYADAFETARGHQAGRDAGVAEMTRSGPEVREALSEITETAYAAGESEAAFFSAQAQEHLMLGRLYAERFLVTNETEPAERTAAELNAASEALDALLPWLQNPERRALAQDAAAGLARFTDGFLVAREAIMARNAALAEMDGYGPLMLAASDAARNAAIAEQGEIAQSSSAAAGRAQAVSLVVAAVALIAAAAVALVLGLRIPNALRTLTGSMNTLASGDTSVAITGERRKDEIGEMARALVVFRDNAREVERLQAEQAEKDALAAQERKQALEAMASKFEAEVGDIVAALADASDQLQTRATELSGVVSGAGERSSSVAAAAEQASGSVEAMASAAEELTASIREVSSQVSQSASAARASSEQAETSAQGLDQLTKAVAGVDEIIRSINDVAEQTNLLALNATIEAARAGDAGKGFAVVASEVKSLAEQTQKLTEEIARRLGDISTASDAAVQATRSIISSIGEIDATSAALSAAVEEQSSATAEISSSAQQAAEGARVVSYDITGVQEAVSRSAEVAETVSRAATELKDRSTTLSREVDSFLSTVRAA